MSFRIGSRLVQIAILVCSPLAQENLEFFSEVLQFEKNHLRSSPMIRLDASEIRFQNLISKHLEHFKDRGFQLVNGRSYCRFCHYSIKIDRKHIKAQLQSHLKSQTHQLNERARTGAASISLGDSEQISHWANGPSNRPQQVTSFSNEVAFRDSDLQSNRSHSPPGLPATPADIGSSRTELAAKRSRCIFGNFSQSRTESIVCNSDCHGHCLQVNHPLTNRVSNATVRNVAARPSQILATTGLLPNLGNRAYSTNPNSTLKEYQHYTKLKTIEPAQHVINVQLNRPEKLNAVDPKMFEEIRDCFTKLNKDKYFRAVVLSASGRIFCSGIDLQSFQSVLSDESRQSKDYARKSLEIRNLISDVQDCVLAVGNCQKPVIAAIHGKCIGAGMDLVSFTDVRYCTKDAAFCVKEVALGLAPDIGSLQGLQKIIGNQSFVREMVFTAKEVFSAEAREMGLVSKVCEDADSLYEASIKVADQIAKKSPVAVQGSKINLDYSREHKTYDGLRYNCNWNAAMLQSEDLIKSVMAVMSKDEEADFEDL